MQKIVSWVKSPRFIELTFLLLILMLANPYFSGIVILDALLGLFFLFDALCLTHYILPFSYG